MEIILETNKKFGYGYQGRLIMGPINSVIDSDPFNLYDILNGMQAVIEEINKVKGTNYELHEVVRVEGDAIEVNKSFDLASAKLAKDIKNETKEFTIPQINNCKILEVGGKEEILFTARGIILLTYFSWKDDHMPKAKEIIRKYCELLAMRGYGMGASKLMRELEILDKDNGAEWIERTYDQYIKNDMEIMNFFQGMI